jgi:cation diffusion facilitator CzcD-associated flavoprotein CzcO
MKSGSAATAVVVGAGATGLSVAKALQESGLAVEVLEQEARIGVPWENRHPQLHLNTHRKLSTLQGVAYPKDTSAFPHKNLVIDQLADFARHHGVSIRHGVEVRAVRHLPDGWHVATNGQEYVADHVVIATGRDRVPFVPGWPGLPDFEGQFLHSSAFGEPSSYAGKGVLVIGAGNSGFDILNHLARIDTGKVWLAARHGPTLLPKRIGNIAVHPFSPIFERLPLPVFDLMLAATQRMVFGDLSKFGLPPAPAGGGTRLRGESVALAVDDGAARAIRAGRITVVPQVQSFGPSDVLLADGRRIAPDVVIAATGYRTGLEPILGHLGVLDAAGKPLFNGDAQDPRWPGLWFAGMRPSVIGCIANANRQAKAIASVVRRMPLV